MGHTPRLNAILRAGEVHRQVTATGAADKLKGKAAADALAKKPAPPAKTQSTSNAAKDDPGAPPIFKKAATVPTTKKEKVRAGTGANKAKPALKDTGDDMNDDASEWLKDLVASYKSEVEARKKKLDTVRDAAKECAENRVAAVTDALKEQEDAAKKIVDALKAKLEAVSKELDRLRSSSADNTTQKDACEDARASLDRELKALKDSCNKERDDAKAAAETKLKETIAEWTTKLKECEAKNATSGAESSKKLDECLGKLAAAQKALKEEQETLAALQKETNEKQKKFAKAVTDACKLLQEALK